MATYQTEQRMIGVDKAGITARIDACNSILERRNQLPTSRVEQIETVKITAEIELVGLEARQSALTEIVQNGRQIGMVRPQDLFQNLQ